MCGSFKSLSCRFTAEIRTPIIGRQLKTLRLIKTSQRYGFNGRKLVTGLCIAGGVSLAAYCIHRPSVDDFLPVTYASSGNINKPTANPTRMVRSENDSTGLHLTLYQYQSCPFCCKVRSYLDYHGFSYDVVEVNSMRRKEISFSQYRKVPILVCRVGKDTYLQMNDSSLIVSLLESYLTDKTQTIEQLLSYYPQLESKNERGKTVVDYPNKYFIMHGKATFNEPLENEERYWRQWTDTVLVHTLSPNIYRTPSEAIQAFRYFSEAGEWAQTFGNFEQNAIVYVGAAAMFFIGRILKKRHHLKDDVRESMYDACKEWTTAVRGAGGKFLGGDRPCLADLAVYGVLSAIEGCSAFGDLVANTDIAPWYQAVKKAVTVNAGQRQVVDNRLTSIM